VNRAELLEAALDAVNARPKAYGPPERNFDRIAALWTTYVDGKNPREEGGLATLIPSVIFDAVDVACMMVLMKVARLEETPVHLDSWIDIAGYAACGAECATGPVIEHEAA
jgi:hypothetical protein